MPRVQGGLGLGLGFGFRFGLQLQCLESKMALRRYGAFYSFATRPKLMQRVQITVRHQGVPLNIYAFRQPARLSELELPFRILPMRAIDLTGVVEIPVAPKEAIDSWCLSTLVQFSTTQSANQT